MLYECFLDLFVVTAYFLRDFWPFHLENFVCIDLKSLILHTSYDGAATVSHNINVYKPNVSIG